MKPPAFNSDAVRELFRPDDAREVLKMMLKRGTRFAPEKIAIAVIYVLTSIVSMVWAFSGTSPYLDGVEIRSLGRTASGDLLEVTNRTGDAWSDVRIVVNDAYLYKVESIEDDQAVKVNHQDLSYFYFVPRTWGRDTWEKLSSDSPPPEEAQKDLEVNKVVVREQHVRRSVEFE